MIGTVGAGSAGVFIGSFFGPVGDIVGGAIGAAIGGGVEIHQFEKRNWKRWNYINVIWITKRTLPLRYVF